MSGGHRAARQHSEARRVIGDLCHVLGINFDDVEAIDIRPGRIAVTPRVVSVYEDGEHPVQVFTIPYF